MIRFDYSGKIVVVTGGTQGIGHGIASAFHEAGATVHITGTRDAATAYEDDLSTFTYHQLKLDDAAARAAFAAKIGDLDILVNNAGQAREDEYEMDGFRNTIEVNLTAPAELCFLFHDTLKARKGAIVNVGSGACFIALKAYPSYTASKSGILGFTRSIADQWARDNIRVNLVAPGFIETRMIDWAANSKNADAILRSIPAHRWGTPKEIASAVLFLASEEASYITGQSIVVDGGLLLR
jgi:3-oxoacyl-[acyl-carrier protein] reductase